MSVACQVTALLRAPVTPAVGVSQWLSALTEGLKVQQSQWVAAMPVQKASQELKIVTVQPVVQCWVLKPKHVRGQPVKVPLLRQRQASGAVVH